MVKPILYAALVAGCSLSGTKNHCETQTDCLDGYTCSAAGECEQGAGSGSDCTPITCGAHCGDIDDRCGGTLSCGACPDHCANHTQDPSETDIDCGGDCGPCAIGDHCAQTTDCATGTCDAGTCRPGTWSTVAPMPTARDRLAAVAGADGLIYAIGGMSSAGASNAVEAYDPMTNSWSARAPMPTPRFELAAVLGTDGRIYAVGGDFADVSDPGHSIIAEVYNPTTNAWQSLPSLPVGRDNLALAADSAGVIYAIGGFDGTAFQTLGSVATWKVGDASWSALPDAMTTARSLHGAATLADGKIYAVGGEHGVATGEIGAFEYYQPGASGWHTLDAMPTARKALGVAALGSSLYAIGGSRYNSTGMRYTSVVEVYDATAHAWSQVTSLPSGRFDHAAVPLGGKIYVIGGELEQTDARTGIVDVFTP